MACNSPYSGSRLGVPGYTFPCGYCSGCRKDKLTMWTDRLKFEILTSPSHTGTFATLTYRDDNCPPDGVSKEHIHTFLKNFRYLYDKVHGRSSTWDTKGNWHSCSLYKYVLTSEYGDLECRPHYHAIFTNTDCWNDNFIFTETWKHGFIELKPANSSSIRYVLKYISSEDKRVIIRSEDGLILNPNFHLFSQGIGKDYIFQHCNEIRKDKGYRLGTKIRPMPQYYKNLLGVQPSSAYLKEVDRDKVTWYVERHPEDLQLPTGLLIEKVKQFFGSASEKTYISKESNGISYGLKGLKDL